jgi:hypothetical protein
MKKRREKVKEQNSSEAKIQRKDGKETHLNTASCGVAVCDVK